MIVTPVAKAPMLLRNSVWLKGILFFLTPATAYITTPVAKAPMPLRNSVWFRGILFFDARNRLHYHAAPLYHSSQRGRLAHPARRTGTM